MSADTKGPFANAATRALSGLRDMERLRFELADSHELRALVDRALGMGLSGSDVAEAVHEAFDALKPRAMERSGEREEKR